MKKYFYFVIGGIFAISVLSGCGRSGASNAKYAEAAATEEAYYDDYEEMAEEDMASDSLMANSSSGESHIDSESLSSRKLIRTVNISAETTNYDELVKNVTSKVKELGGYIESSNETMYTYSEPQRRNSNFTIRVPKDNADKLIGIVSDSSNVVNKSENIEDVTLDYVDVESRKKTLLAEQERLLDLMKRAETVEDIISIEGRLSEVQYELESSESRLRTFDNKIDYTTIYLNIDEVSRITPVPEESFFSRIATGFVESLYDVIEGLIDFITWFLTSIPYFMVFGAAVAFVGVIIVRPLTKAAKEKREKKNTQQ